MFTSLIMMDKPDLFGQAYLSTSFSTAFPDCAVTRAQARKFADVIDLSDSFIAPSSEPVECQLKVETELDTPSAADTLTAEPPSLKVGSSLLCNGPTQPLSIS